MVLTEVRGDRFIRHLYNTDGARRTDRSFPTARDEAFYCLACAVLEQAVIDWRFLDNGEMTACHVDAQYIFSREVEEFLTSEWFDTLLSYALPQYTPQEIRAQLKVKEPEGREEEVDKKRTATR